MTWIQTIGPAEATGELKDLYARIAGPGGAVDNILVAHSLRPRTMEGHMALYKSVLHDAGNRTPKWYLELVGVWVSRLNACSYCAEHHSKGLERLLVRKQGEAGASLHAALLVGLAALEAGAPSAAALGELLTPAEVAGLDFAAQLTRTPGAVASTDLDALREAGWDDGGLLELNQVVAYFNYANRTVLGLGVSLEGDQLGLSPGDSHDPGNWHHS